MTVPQSYSARPLYVRKRVVLVAATACLASALMSAPAMAAVTGSFASLPSEVARNTPVTVKLTVTNSDSTDSANVALGIRGVQFVDDDETSPPLTVQGHDCQGGQDVNPLPAGTPPGTVACRWETTAKNGGSHF